MRALCHRWVEHCLSRGDCGRLLEPIFLSLLSPPTARVSVLHATVSQQQPEETSPRNSSVQVANNRVISVTCTEASVVFHLVKEGSSWHHEKNKSIKTKVGILSPSVESTAPTFPSFSGSIVNPFALVSSESEFLQDPSCSPEPCPPSVTSSAPSSPTLERRREENLDEPFDEKTTESIVSGILDELVARAVDSSNFLHLPLEELTFASLTSSSDRRDSERGREEGKVVVHFFLIFKCICFCICICIAYFYQRWWSIHFTPTCCSTWPQWTARQPCTISPLSPT